MHLHSLLELIDLERKDNIVPFLAGGGAPPVFVAIGSFTGAGPGVGAGASELFSEVFLSWFLKSG